MSRLKQLIKGQKYSGAPRSGGARTNFYKKVSGKNVVRIFPTPDLGTGELLTFYQYLNHWGQKAVCPKTFVDEAHCEICEQADEYFESARDLKAEMDSATTAAKKLSLKQQREDVLKEAGKYKAKKQSWWVVVPQGTTEYHIWDMPHGLTQRILGIMAQKGGWVGDANFEDEDFADAVEAGMETCTGAGGHDFIIDFDKNRDAREMYQIKLSTRPGRKLDLEEDPPCMEDLFRRIKGIGNPDEAPKPQPQKKVPGRKPAAKKKAPARKKKAAAKKGE